MTWRHIYNGSCQIDLDIEALLEGYILSFICTEPQSSLFVTLRKLPAYAET